MIPIRDTIPCYHRPVITWSLIGVNIFFFIYSQILPEEQRQNLFYLLGTVPARYTHPEWAQQAGYPVGNYLSFIASMFLHGGWLHIIMNMWLLWIFGDNIEDRMGPTRFILFYVLCGLVAQLIYIVTNVNSPVPIIGASGAIAGILGAYFFLYPYARIVLWIPILFLPIFVKVPAIAFLGLWLGIQFYNVTKTAIENPMFTDVAWWGHIGGFFAGVILYRFFLLPDRLAPTDTE